MSTVSALSEAPCDNITHRHREIVARDAVALEKPINRMVSRFLSLKFPNRPQLADFVFDREKELTPKEVADLAVSLKNAGWRVDQSELEERTGFTLEKVEESAPQGGGFAFARAKAAETKSAESPKELLEAFSKDLSPAAEAVKELLKDPTPEKAKELLERLPDLLPEDPEMAAIIADEMAKTFASETIVNKEEPDEVLCLNTDREENGRFAVKGSGDRAHAQENNLEKRQRTCKEALEAYKASKDHPSVEDVASGKIDIREALKKGFEATFGGQKVVFFTQQKIGDKYDGRGESGRIEMIKHVLAVRSNMFPVRHHGDQVGLVERLTSKNSNQRHVVTVDRETGIAVNVMRCNDAYIRKNYK